MWVCVSIYIQMYTVYRLQVRLCHATSPTASSATEITTWWERRTFLAQEDLQEGAGPAQRWGSGSCAVWEQTQSTAGAKALDIACGSLLGMVGLTEGRDLWLSVLKSNQVSILLLSHLCSIQAIVLHSSTRCSHPGE